MDTILALSFRYQQRIVILLLVETQEADAFASEKVDVACEVAAALTFGLVQSINEIISGDVGSNFDA